MLISFVIGCYRSEYTIRDVVSEIIDVISSNDGYEYEIILINDCSPDNVIDILKDLAMEDSRIIVIDLAKNVGKASAMLAGCTKVNGEYVVFMDDDGQCPVDQIFELIEPLDAGYDMAIADYSVRKESLLKRIGSFFNHKVMQLLIGMPKGVRFSNFNIRKKYICDAMVKYSNPYPNLQGLALQVTKNIKMVPMEERERKEGKSGYTFFKSLKLFLNGITGFSVVPLRIASVLGVSMSVVGFIMIIYLIVSKIVHPGILPGYSSTMVMIVFIGGIIMMLLGIIGEYLGRIYISINNVPQYTIKNVINHKDVDKAE